MKTIKYALLAVASLLLLNGCGKFGNINVDPNNPSTKDTRYLFSRAMQGVTFAVYTSSPAPSVDMYDPFSQLYPHYFAEAKNVQYTQFGIKDFNMTAYYTTFLKNLHLIKQMNTTEGVKDSEAVSSMGANNVQLGIAMTLEAFYYMHMTDIVGMIYYDEALLGDDGNFTPKFETQEHIYAELDKKLVEAYALLGKGGAINNYYDILYGGNLAKWQKLNASLRMLMAIKLSDVAPEVGKARFAKAYADGGIATNPDNFSYQYTLEDDNMNPIYSNYYVDKRKDFYPSATLVDKFIALKDPRVYTYAKPTAAGELFAVPFGTPRAKIGDYTGKVSELHPFITQKDAKITIISATRMLLVEAEAAVRGWITADAKALYAEAIKLSFENKQVKTAIEQLTADGLFDALQGKYALTTTVADYLAQDAVKLQGSNQEMINQIALQRWLAGFNENGIEAWSDWRRLNYPKLEVGEAGAINVSHIPYRRFYYLNDYETNRENYDKVIKTQGPDNFDTRVWWDVADNK
ncbi:hypothetical protein IX308_001313 [Porphyromonas levii]|uniref:SusD/RagB family nutrient-binding outer membrane lipoprotein n=1 Tax=Porphyromonas levii TaxID=28114 RepID=UPI001B8B16DB|nr:SusD/RagB family nutrient-binding outer membrane lipoprotein [Porphyromonas levii]MBR8732006.1 hypothetical protein [Porphyromonas levii]MBR8764281.1 hypothetical protein [Porphyromonas levii]MBR8765893.1 hypothetical protein [Porphyromonas levii]MBR8785118.1 hypothetical protein [Porphyromonas levii]